MARWHQGRNNTVEQRCLVRDAQKAVQESTLERKGPGTIYSTQDHASREGGSQMMAT